MCITVTAGRQEHTIVAAVLSRLVRFRVCQNDWWNLARLADGRLAAADLPPCNIAPYDRSDNTIHPVSVVSA